MLLLSLILIGFFGSLFLNPARHANKFLSKESSFFFIGIITSGVFFFKSPTPECLLDTIKIFIYDSFKLCSHALVIIQNSFQDLELLEHTHELLSVQSKNLQIYINFLNYSCYTQNMEVSSLLDELI